MFTSILFVCSILLNIFLCLACYHLATELEKSCAVITALTGELEDEKAKIKKALEETEAIANEIEKLKEEAKQ